MSWIEIELAEGKTAYRPGEEVVGKVAWSVEGDAAEGDRAAPPERAEVHLAWFTRGVGDEDSDLVASVELPEPAASDWREFRLRLPAGPYSVTGNLVSVAWAVEAVLEPGSRAHRVEIVVSPTGHPVRLHPDDGSVPKS